MKNIISREFLNLIRSLQFMALLILTVVLFTANGLIFVKASSERTSAYRKQAVQMTQNLSTMVAWLAPRPNPLNFIAEGGDRNRPTEYTLQPKGSFWALQPNSRSFKLPIVPPLDWTFIIGALFSLYVILLGYNSISGEKEDGTLRLVLANPIGRVKLLTAKYLSILLAAAVPLLAGSLISLLLFGLAEPQNLTADNLSRVAVVLFVALAYVSLFVFLSLFVSSLIHRSSLVLLTLLAVWVVFAIIIPSSSTVLIEKLSSAPREIQTARMLEPTIQKEIWDQIKEIGKKTERGELKTEAEVKAAADKAFEDGQTKLNLFYEDFNRAQRKRVGTARNLSRLSPSALFRFAAEDIVQSGVTGEDQFLRQIRDYSRVYDQYILKKLGKLVQTSNWSFSTSLALNGKDIQIQSPRPEEYNGDKSDFPRFVERRTAWADGLKGALGDLAGLLIWNILLAGLAFSAFLRSDVR